MATKFLMVGDIHLREGANLDDTVNALGFAAVLADARDVDAVLIAGDVFEGKSTAVERAIFGHALNTLSAHPSGTRREVLIVKGNHDQAQDLEVFAGYPGVRVFERPELVTILKRQGDDVEGVDVYCVPWPDKAFLAAGEASAALAGEALEQAGGAALGSMLRFIKDSRESAIKGHADPLVVLAHLQVSGAITSSAQPLVGRAIEVTTGDLQAAGAVFTALGHVHKPQELAPGVAYIGGLTCHDFGEEAEEKRLGVLTVYPSTDANVQTKYILEWVPVPCRKWLTIDAVVIDGAGVVEHVAGESETAGWSGNIEQCIPGAIAGANVRYKYRCTEAEEHLFDHARIRLRFAMANSLKVEPDVTREARVRCADVSAATTNRGKLEAWAHAVDVEVTPGMLEKLAELEATR